MNLPFDPEIIKPYLLPVAVAAFLLFRHLRFKAVMNRLPGLIQAGAVIVDVRSPAEFSAGCCPGSLNIPLDALASRADELDKGKTVILCCASGARSGLV